MKIINTVLAVAMFFTGQILFAQALNKVQLYDNRYPAAAEIQKQINGQMLNLLRSNQFDKMRELANKGRIDLYHTHNINAKDWPVYVNRDEPNLSAYMDEIKGETGTLVANEVSAQFPDGKEKLLNTVSASKAFYYALTKYYTELYGHHPAKFNLNNYKDFYAKYKDAWFAPQVEYTMAVIWQDGVYFNGDIFDKNNDGAKIYNAVYTAKLTGFKNPYQYAGMQPDFRFHKGDVLENLNRIYGAMYARSLQTNDKQIFHKIKTLWLEDLITPMPYNDENVNKHNRDVIYILNTYDPFYDDKRDSWETFAIQPVTQEQKKMVREHYERCLKNPLIKDKNYCISFKTAALRHGYFYKTDAELKQELKQAANTEKKNPRTALGMIWPNK